jgi:SAM-dependent methyltransferase
MNRRAIFAQPSRLDPLISTTQCRGEQISWLAARLEKFYNSTQDYAAFNTPSDQGVWLRLVADEIRMKFREGCTKIKVLEVGAGCGSVFQGIKNLDRSMFHYTAQDITETVSERLRQVADAVYLRPLRTLEGQFEVIFSLFVLEHIAAPGEFLADVDRLLSPGGTHIIVCPRYDLPGFVCPSMRHLRGMKLFQIEAKRHICNALTRFGGAQPAFWVNTDPALFHMAWRRDVDAVHIVCQNELVVWHSRLGYQTRRLSPQTLGLVDFFLKRLATVCLAFDKRA